ncbi:siderophore-interacting protein [Luteimonas sp. BDR2-5]|uniref:siderophore-interacting protein n=1 Tax=Proluteimonas luteida TaxID=2878685 RepID=UPI001E29F18D|nr:siderophore-interacting protein [Luteimonas sp. BDR2-5]MCD9028581.1 siderophore-interacting protein [Luteimonas sp. BDR2-5]
MSALHEIRRVRHELVRRELTVLRTQHLSPHYLRVTFGGQALAGFTSLGFDDHVKLFFPDPADPQGEPSMRDYTPRRYDAQRQELEIDFVLHGHGPAASWAARASVGQTLVLGGPRGSNVIPADFAVNVLVGDATAWPAISRRLEELPAEAGAWVIVDLGEVADTLPFRSRADVHIQWLHGDTATSGERLVAAVAALPLPDADTHFWAAGETTAMRQVRPAFVARGGPKAWIKAAGYWRRGAAGAHETIEE